MWSHILPITFESIVIIVHMIINQKKKELVKNSPKVENNTFIKI